jgi:hypothetical protein
MEQPLSNTAMFEFPVMYINLVHLIKQSKISQVFIREKYKLRHGEVRIFQNLSILEHKQK